MKVVIAGAGSVGLLLGSFLSEMGIDVTMFVRREEQAQQIRRNGIRRIDMDSTESVYHVSATVDIRTLDGDALWIIATKYSGVSSVLTQMEEAGIRNPVIFIQNGIGHVEIAYKTGLPDIAFATVEHGARRTDDSTVSHNGTGLLTIAVGRGDQHQFDIFEKLNSTTFPVIRHEDAEYVLMRKVLINCMINPLTALLQVKNGELINNRYCNELFISLYKELINAFPEMASVLSFETVVNVCRNTTENRSSMFADRLAGRPMEIETIVTAVIRKGEDMGKSLPLLTAFEKMLYAVNGREVGG